VISIELDGGVVVRAGDILALRLEARYFEEVIESLEVNNNPVLTATGPCRVGIRTSVEKAAIPQVGQAVFTRNRVYESADG
jgi:hypothetical protein